MKKIVNSFSAKILLPAMVAGLLISSCASNDTSSSTDTITGTDTSMMTRTDTMAIDRTGVTPADTSMRSMDTSMNKATMDSVGKLKRDTSSKATTGVKKARKGKVTILPADARSKSTTMEMDKEGFYANTEVLPAYPGGQKALERFFEDNIVYPVAAEENSTEGTVKMTFAVDENGKVYNPIVMGNKIGDGIEEEALRVFTKMPTWTPGRIKGKNVKTRYTLPVRFQLY